MEHDGTGFGAGWFLDKIVISGKGNQWYFLCGKWLDKGKKIIRKFEENSC